MMGEDGAFPPFPGMGEDGAFPPFPGMGEDGAFPQFPGMGEDGDFPQFPGMGEDGAFPTSPFDEESFKTKNATMTVELNNKKKSYDAVTLSIGGSSSRSFGKQGYNLKIRGKKNLYGRSQFRLRPDAREATFLRSKLTCDIHNRLGLPSISANYATLYINGEYMGFYILLDAFKLSWVESVYDDKDSTTLYQCKNMNNQLTVKSSSTGCTNENEEVTDNSEWIELLTRLDEAQSAEDIEDIFDVDQFLTEIAFEYLSGSWDHYLNFGHNFYMYKPKGDKWKFLLYDFDGELGQDVSMGANGGPGQFNATPKTESTDFPTYTFEEWAQPRHLLDILIFKDSTRFDNILKNFVKKAFNPTVLFPHIDELKKFIRPYVELDKTPDENGKYPGRLNEKAGDYSLAQWEANSEFTKISSAQGFGQSYGLKYWILAKYRYVCEAYKIDDCDPVYLDENYEIPVDKEVEAKEDMTIGFPFMNPKNKSKDTEPSTTDTVVEPPAATTSIEPPTATTPIEPPTATTPIELPDDITPIIKSPFDTSKKPSSFIKKKCFKKTSKSKEKSKFDMKNFKNTKKYINQFGKNNSNKYNTNKYGSSKYNSNKYNSNKHNSNKHNSNKYSSNKYNSNKNNFNKNNFNNNNSNKYKSNKYNSNKFHH